MPSLASCHRCHGFVADLSRACPHCDAAPPRWRTLARVLSTTVLGAVSMMTLMACYGAGPDRNECLYDGDPTCSCEYYGDCSECSVDNECPTGEYCRPGGVEGAFCDWGGTCAEDWQCPEEMVCDPLRGSCHPGVRPGCDGHSQCLTPDERCDLDTRTCVPTTACGFGQPGCEEGLLCEPGWNICVPCEGEACGSCAAEILCLDEPPACADGSQPAVSVFGCFTGGCLSDATCADQACAVLDAAACGASDACNPVYGGVNCSNPDGDPCSGGASCTCESYVYLDCVAAPP